MHVMIVHFPVGACVSACDDRDCFLSEQTYNGGDCFLSEQTYDDGDCFLSEQTCADGAVFPAGDIFLFSLLSQELQPDPHLMFQPQLAEWQPSHRQIVPNIDHGFG
jgi:hypothetical protein